MTQTYVYPFISLQNVTEYKISRTLVMKCVN